MLLSDTRKLVKHRAAMEKTTPYELPKPKETYRIASDIGSYGRERAIHLKRRVSRLGSEHYSCAAPHPSTKRLDVANAYPRLLAALRWSCMFSPFEAEACILGYREVGPQFCDVDAIAQIGSAHRAISHAWRCRNVARLHEDRDDAPGDNL